MASQEILLFLGSLKPFPEVAYRTTASWKQPSGKGRARDLYGLFAILYFSLIKIYLMGCKFPYALACDTQFF